MSGKKQTPRPRTYARNRSFSRRGYEKLFESDGEYFLKLVIVVVLGSFWVKFTDPIIWLGFRFYGVPVGLLLGLILITRFEKSQLDRKIWYAVLVIVTVLCFFAPAIIYI